MKVIIDEREHGLFEKCQLILQSQKNASYVILSKEVLQLGDIFITTDDNKPLIIIERKTFSDLLSSIKDGRYEEQSYRLQHSSGIPGHSIIYLLEGMFSQLNNPNDKKIIYSAMTSLFFFKGFTINRTSTIQETAEWILHMADKIERSFAKNIFPYYLSNHFRKQETNSIEDNSAVVSDASISTATTTTTASNTNIIQSEITQSSPTNADYCSVVKKQKKDNITTENIGEIILCQIPGISSTTAISIMKQFSGFPHFLEEIKKNPQCLENIVIENGKQDENKKGRKISKSCVENIRRFLL
jgi:ERCC4-type nuclease